MKVASTILTTVILLAGTLLLATPTASAEAGVRGCVTRAEYNQVHKGYKVQRVHRIFGHRGQLIRRSPNRLVRNYLACTFTNAFKIRYRIRDRRGAPPRVLRKGHWIVCC